VNHTGGKLKAQLHQNETTQINKPTNNTRAEKNAVGTFNNVRSVILPSGGEICYLYKLILITHKQTKYQ